MSKDASTLLLIASDAGLATAIKVALADTGLDVEHVHDIDAALQAQSPQHALALLAAPDASGPCARWRDGSDTPLLILSPDALDDAGRLQALQAGADAALHWPAQSALLLAQVHALLRTGTRAAALQARLAAEKRENDAFLSTLGHELRTPLNSIMGWADILVRQPRESDFATGLQSIDRNARLQAQLITDLLDAARLSSGRLTLDVERINPIPVLDAALSAVASAAAARAIGISRHVDDSADSLHADPARLQQVLGHLLGNAVKHTRKNGKVDVSLSRDGGRLHVAVSDDGTGIEADQLPTVFDGFRRPAGQRRAASLGLELYMVRQLVELHGGTVQASSAGKNQGARFEFWLPM